jgi:hypothetical protein
VTAAQRVRDAPGRTAMCIRSSPRSIRPPKSARRALSRRSRRQVASEVAVGTSGTEVGGDQRPHPCLGRDPAEFGHVGVRGQDVVDEGLRQAEDRQTLGVEGLVHQDVGVPGEPDDVRGRGRVAGEDDAAVVGVETVGVGGVDRAVRDEHGGDLDVVVLHDREGRHGGGGVRRGGAGARGGSTSWTRSRVAGSMPMCSVMKKVGAAAYACPASLVMSTVPGTGPGAPATVEVMPAGPGPYTSTGLRKPCAPEAPAASIGKA